MVKDTPSLKQIAAMVGFTLSVFGLLLFLWLSFGGTVPLKPKKYQVEVAFPEAATLVEEADVRMAGVNIGKVKVRSLTDNGHRTLATIQIEPRFAPIPKDTRAILRQKSLLGETYVELAPGDKSSGKLPDHGRLPDGHVEGTTQLDEIFSTFDRQTRNNFQAWLHDSGIATSGDYPQNFNDALGNAAPFFEAGTRLLTPLDDQEIALRRLVRNTGRVFGAISRENGALRGLIVNGNDTFGALASRDQALADTFQVFPTFLTETRATVRRLESFARNANPLATDLKQPARDLAPTLRDLGALAPNLEALFHELGPFIDTADVGAPQRLHRPQRLHPGDPARHHRELRLQALRRGGPQPDRERSGVARAAVLRAAAVALQRPALPGAPARQGAEGGRAQGRGRDLAGEALDGREVRLAAAVEQLLDRDLEVGGEVIRVG